MSIAIGMRDVLKCWKYLEFTPALNEIGLLDKQLSFKVNAILFELGMDVRFPYDIDACIYRDRDDKVGLGYRFVGRMRMDDEWTKGKGCSVMERVQAVAYNDPDLAREMCEMLNSRHMNIKNFIDVNTENDEGNGEDDDDFLSPSCSQDSRMMQTMMDVAKRFGWGDVEK